MKYFVTGATGFIGSAVVAELIKAGHQVVGLARSDKSAKALEEAGAQVLRGDLEDVETLKKGASASDGVAHLGFIHDFANFAAACATDKKAVLALMSALRGTSKPFIASFGTLLLPNDHTATEEDFQPREGGMGHRFETEDEILNEAKASGLNAMALRLSPTVHGDGDGAFIPSIIDAARKNGRSAYVDGGMTRWPTVHRFDAAKLYKLALENPKSGQILHAVAEEGVSFKEIATTIGKQLNLPVVSISSGEEAGKHFGFLAGFANLDNPVSSAKTQQTFGWKPTEVGLVADLEQGHYFEAGKGPKFNM